MSDNGLGRLPDDDLARAVWRFLFALGCAAAAVALFGGVAFLVDRWGP